MKNVLIKGNISDELIEKIKKAVESENLEMNLMENDDEIERVMRNEYDAIVPKNRKKSLSEIMGNFIDEYAIEFKKNKVSIPSYFSLATGDEYNDETYDKVLQSVEFFDENKKRISVDFEVEYDGYENEFSYAAKEMLQYDEEIDPEEVENYLESEIIEISRGI